MDNQKAEKDRLSKEMEQLGGEWAARINQMRKLLKESRENNLPTVDSDQIKKLIEDCDIYRDRHNELYDQYRKLFPPYA